MTDEEKMEYINRLSKYISTMASKFCYYTQYEKEDLEQEAACKVLQILNNKDSRAPMDESSTIKFLAKSIINLYLNIVRDYPSYRLVETTLEKLGEEVCSVPADNSHVVFADLLQEESLDSRDRQIITLLFAGYSHQATAAVLDVDKSTVTKRVKRIRKVWRTKYGTD